MVFIIGNPNDSGIPSQWSADLTSAEVELKSGDEPALLTTDEVVADNQNIAQLTVVGFSGGKLVPATYSANYGASGVRPIGVLVTAVVTGTGNTRAAPVYRGGCLNPDALVWDASFDDEFKKVRAFEGAPWPTRIIIRESRQAFAVPTLPPPPLSSMFARSGQTFALGAYQGDSAAVDFLALGTWLGTGLEIADYHLHHAGCRFSWTRYNLAALTIPPGITTMHWSFPPITKPAPDDLSAPTPTFARALAGEYDADWIALGQMMRDKSPSGPILVRIAWEFQLLKWAWTASTQAEQLVLAQVFRRVVTILRPVSNRFVFVWCPNGPGGNAHDDIVNAYPGDDVVDIIGMDIYIGSNDAGYFGYIRDDARGLTWLKNFAATHGKPWAFPELGHQGDTAADAQNVRYMAEWCLANGAQYVSYWNSDADYPGLISDGGNPVTAAAFKDEYGPPTIVNPASATAYTGEAISVPLVANHGRCTWSIVGGPSPWSISGSNLVAAAQAAGTYNVTVRVTDARGLTAVLPMTVTVLAMPTFVVPGANLIVNSEAFENASWTKQGLIVTANQSAGLNPSLITADRLIESATTGFHRAVRSYTTTTGGVYTLEAFVTPLAANPCYVVNIALGNNRATFNLQTGQVLGYGQDSGYPVVSAPEILYVGAGRWRIRAVFTEPSGQAREVKIDLNRPVVLNSNASPWYAGDGVSGVDVAAMWLTAA